MNKKIIFIRNHALVNSRSKDFWQRMYTYSQACPQNGTHSREFLKEEDVIIHVMHGLDNQEI